MNTAMEQHQVNMEQRRLSKEAKSILEVGIKIDPESTASVTHIDQIFVTRAMAGAMRRALLAAKVKFFRVCTVDVSGQVRAKAMPLSHASADQLLQGPAFVECIMGLPIYGDALVKASGLTASGCLNLRPDVNSMQILPFTPSHARVMGDLVDDAGIPSPICPRAMLKRAVQRAETIMGHRITVGAEIEFILQKPHTPSFSDSCAVDSYNFAVSRGLDENAEFLEQVHDMLQQQEIPVELIHAEAAPGQYEVVLKYADAITTADNIIAARETIAACARKFNMIATMVPKPFLHQAGNGMHLHFSFSERQSPYSNTFIANDHQLPVLRCQIRGSEEMNKKAEDVETYGVSHTGRAFMAGVVEHLPGLSAVTTPSTNSFRRLAPGCWAGAYQGWGIENKEAPVRLCTTGSGKPYHFELKTVDGTCNPYLAIAAVIGCGVDGVTRGLSLPRALPSDMSIPTDSNSDKMCLKPMPTQFGDALEALHADQILFKQIFGERLYQAYIAVKGDENAFFTSNGMDFEKEVATLIAKGV